MFGGLWRTAIIRRLYQTDLLIFLHTVMLAKHPQASPTPLPADPTPTPVWVMVEGLTEPLSPSQMVPPQVHPASGPPISRRLCSVLLQAVANNTFLASFVVNLPCTSHAPPEVVPHPYRCVALHLQEERWQAHAHRHIGEVLHCLTSNCISWTVQDKSPRILTPLQVGVGVSTGYESTIHALTWV